MSYSPYQIIQKKRKNQPLSKDEISFMIHGFLDGSVPAYQMSSFLMAWTIMGSSSVEETFSITEIMLKSGAHIKYDGKGFIDKHSTGGVGDKASFVLGPIASACGVKVPMIAGRALGHTGGTIDKVEAIPGFKVDLSLDDFRHNTQEYGFCLIGQTPQIAPADGKIYALRDVTDTVECIPLITASIMSKKLAEGAQGIVMDLKYGHGAFMKDVESATELALSMKAVAEKFDCDFTALITDMNQPLGNKVGHSLEIIESIDTLKGNGPEDLTEISIELAAHMIKQAGLADSLENAKQKARESIENGKALEEFAKLIKRQGGDERVVEDYSLLPLAKEKTVITAPQDGHLNIKSCEKIGYSLIEIGGGRKVQSDQIDFSVGLDFHKKQGELVKKGDPILSIIHHDNQQEKVNNLKNHYLKEILEITSNSLKRNLIEKTI